MRLMFWIVFLKKATRPTVRMWTPESWEAIQRLHLQAPSFLWPLNTEQPSGRLVRSCGPELCRATDSHFHPPPTTTLWNGIRPTAVSLERQNWVWSAMGGMGSCAPPWFHQSTLQTPHQAVLHSTTSLQTCSRVLLQSPTPKSLDQCPHL